MFYTLCLRAEWLFPQEKATFDAVHKATYESKMLYTATYLSALSVAASGLLASQLKRMVLVHLIKEVSVEIKAQSNPAAARTGVS